MNTTNPVKKLFFVLTVLACLPGIAGAAEIKRITVAGITGKIPLEYQTEKQGPAGAYVEIWKLWSSKTGIEVNYNITSREEAERALLNGRVDAVMGYTPSPSVEERFILIHDIYVSEIYIYRSGKLPPVETINDLRPFRTGIRAADAFKLAGTRSRISFLIKDEVSDLVESCESGDINVFLADEAVTNYLMARSGKWRNFVQSAEPAFIYGIPAAVRGDNKALADVITSGFGRITADERGVIEKTWSGGNFKYRIPLGYIAAVFVIVAAIGGVVLIWWWNFQLQRKIDEATEELKVMKEEAEAANLAKSRFLDNISHELRTPLTLILAPVEGALNGKPLVRENLEMIRRNGRNLLSMINDLLDLSRITAGRMKLYVSETDLGELVKLYCAEMESAAEYNGLTLSCSVPEEPVTAYIDRGRFSGIISNFFSNSLKFTEGGGSITISLARDGDDIILRFTDTGPGIPQDKIDTIFDRFSQAEATLSRQHESTGIGLSIVREIAGLHGCTVSVDSRFITDNPDDHGTDFFVRIPSGKSHLEGRPDVEFIEPVNEVPALQFTRGITKDDSDKAGCSGESKPEKDRASILIVEDNVDMRCYLKKLVSVDYNVYTATNGAEALEILANVESADLIISDVMMPVMDGHELLVRINSDERLSGIPVIFLTARSDDFVKHQGLELGAVDYVIKPFNPDELLLRIKNQMQLGVMRNDLRRKNDELYAKLKLKVQSDVKKTAVNDEMKSRMESVCSFIKENFRNEINRDLIAATIGMNPDIFSRNFNQYTGKSLPDYINSLRVEDAKILLRETDKTVSRVAIETGFENLRTFNRVFKKFTGMNPSEFREGVYFENS